jgi:4-hydroxy-tetrahydrodipicolinate synthase
VIDRALRAKAHGVDGIVSCAPFYLKPDQAEIVRHYTMLQEAVDLPILAYDIPGAVQTKIERPTLATLAASGVLSGLKDSSGQEANFRGVLLDTAQYPEFSVFTGSELMADVALWLGAAGIVPGMGNVDPGGYVRLYDAAVAGDWGTAKAEQERLYRLFRIISVGQAPGIGFSAAAWGSFKVALKLRGVISSATPTAPMSSLSPGAGAKIEALLKEASLEQVAVTT